MKNIPILYENDDILIINKQFGLAVQGGEGILHPLDEVLAEQLHRKIYLVHRLDRATSGILVVAKNPAAAAEYTSLFAGKKVVKEYQAVCFGCPEKSIGTVSDSVVRKGQEKSAMTSYEVLASSCLSPDEADTNAEIMLSHVRLVLGTGRMHQIRIHMNSIKMPIVADDKYGNFKVNRMLKKRYGVSKLQLAAVRLSIPVKEKTETFQIELPDHMQELISMVF